MHDLTLNELQIMLSMFALAAQQRGLNAEESSIRDRLTAALEIRMEIEDINLMSECEGCKS